MVQKTTKLLTILIALSLMVISCNKDDDNDNDNDLNATTVKIDASSYTDWVYFSFSTGGLVTENDPANSTSWDLGLMRHAFRTNSGTSGSGNGGVINAGAVDFDTYLEAPSNGYTVDDTVLIGAADDPMHIPAIPVPGSSVISYTWGTLDMTTHQYTMSNNVFVIKTADGKYAKMIVKNYYSDEGTSGNYTIDYVYQEDGTTSFE